MNIEERTHEINGEKIKGTAARIAKAEANETRKKLISDDTKLFDRVDALLKNSYANQTIRDLSNGNDKKAKKLKDAKEYYLSGEFKNKKEKAKINVKESFENGLIDTENKDLYMDILD